MDRNGVHAVVCSDWYKPNGTARTGSRLDLRLVCVHLHILSFCPKCPIESTWSTTHTYLHPPICHLERDEQTGNACCYCR